MALALYLPSLRSMVTLTMPRSVKASRMSCNEEKFRYSLEQIQKQSFGTSQCGNVRIFLPLRFYVKSILMNLKLSIQTIFDNSKPLKMLKNGHFEALAMPKLILRKI